MLFSYAKSRLKKIRMYTEYYLGRKRLEGGEGKDNKILGVNMYIVHDTHV